MAVLSNWFRRQWERSLDIKRELIEVMTKDI